MLGPEVLTGAPAIWTRCCHWDPQPKPRVHSQKNTPGLCRQLKNVKVTQVTNGYIPIGYDERHRASPMAEQHSALAHNSGHVVRTFCPMRWKSWKAMLDETKNTVHNQLSKKVKANKINREKKTLLHHSGSRPFSYRMEVRRKKGSKFPKIDVFADVYVRPRDELT